MYFPEQTCIVLFSKTQLGLKVKCQVVENPRVAVHRLPDDISFSSTMILSFWKSFHREASKVWNHLSLHSPFDWLSLFGILLKIPHNASPQMSAFLVCFAWSRYNKENRICQNYYCTCNNNNCYAPTIHKRTKLDRHLWGQYIFTSFYIYRSERKARATIAATRICGLEKWRGRTTVAELHLGDAFQHVGI